MTRCLLLATLSYLALLALMPHATDSSLTRAITLLALTGVMVGGIGALWLFVHPRRTP